MSELDMAKGDLTFDAEPRPAHVRMLERIIYLAEIGFDDVPEEQRAIQECAVVREICFRVVGTIIPVHDGVEVADNIADALSDLNGRCFFDESKAILAGTIGWVVRTYLT